MGSKLKKLTFIITLAMGLVISSCGSSSKKEIETGISDSTSDQVDDALSGIELNADSDSGKLGPLTSVYFPYNSSGLPAAEKDKLDVAAAFLKRVPSVEIQIEGHADERGGAQFNLALGEQRAKSIRDYLVALGVSGSRITTISFGKERPIAFGHDESAWSQNRRGNFVVTAK